MPDVEKTVNIKINVDDAELSKIDTAEGKVRDMVDKLKEVKGGTFDIKPGGGGATPSGKTPDRDPSFQMLRTINITLNKILGAMGSYGGRRIRRQGSSDPYERVSGKIINEISNANKYAAKGTYKDNSGEKPGKLYGKAWVEDFLKRTYEPMSRPVALPKSITNFSNEMESAYENTVHFSKAITKITSEITAQAIARAHQETLMKGGAIGRRDWVEEERNRGLAQKRKQYDNYLDMLEKEGAKRQREKENVSRVETARLRNLVETAQLSSTEQLTKYTRDIVQNAGREPFQAQQKRMGSYVADMRAQQMEMVESWEEMFGPMSEKVSEKFSDMMNRVIAKRMDEMTNMYVAAAKKNKDASNTSVDAANDWRKGIRGMITGALIDFHLLRVVAQQSKVLATYMDLVGKSFGVLVDVMLLPMLPFFVILSKSIIGVAMWFNQLNPLIKTAVSLFASFTAVLFMYGAFKGGMTGGIFGALKGGIGTVRGGFGKVLGRASGGPLAFGQTAIVGENGPEMLLPTSGGFHVVPNNQLRMLAGGTLGETAGYGLGGAAMGGLLGGTRGAAIGGLVGAGVGASGLGGYLPGAIGGAAQAFYSNPGVQGTIVALSSIASSINAVLAPIAPILGIVGGVISASHMTGGKAAEATTRVGTVLNKTMQSVGFAVQNVVARSAQSTNLILTMILMKIPELLAGLGLPPIPTGSKTPPRGETKRTPGKPEPEKPPEPEKGRLPPEPERGRLPPEPDRGRLPPEPDRGRLPPEPERGKLPRIPDYHALPPSGGKLLPELPEFKIPDFKALTEGTDSGMLDPFKFAETIHEKVMNLRGWEKVPTGEEVSVPRAGVRGLAKAGAAGGGLGALLGLAEGMYYGDKPEDILKGTIESALVGAAATNPVGLAAAIFSTLTQGAGEGTNIGKGRDYGMFAAAYPEYTRGTAPSQAGQWTEDNRKIEITINTTSQNPNAIADEVAKIFKQNASRTGMI